MMSILAALAIAFLLALLTISSYIDRLYSEMGKFLAREFQENLDVWVLEVEPRLGQLFARRDRIALSAALLMQMSLAGLTLLFGVLLFAGTSASDRPSFDEVAQAILGAILVIVLFNRLLPFVFFTRTRGRWILRLRPFLRILFILVLPVTLLLSFLLSIAELAEPTGSEQNEEELSGLAVDALIEAGEEEGIIEEGDRDLVRSAVEFGDKVVREVMTPRPQMFAVAGDTTLEEFIARLKDHAYSRVPVYSGSLDQITGIAFTHDLLQISDDLAATQKISAIQRPAAFVPETKYVNQLLREMQREKQHMRIVIDEYGDVAGLVTINDLIEEIVGAFREEREGDNEQENVVREPDGSWSVPGGFEVGRLKGLLNAAAEIEQEYQATTVAGLVSEIAGHIPLPGEVVVVDSLRFEVIASSDRRVERLRVSAIEAAGS